MRQLVLAAFFLPFSLFASPPLQGPLIVYYANETSPEGKEAENFDQVLKWLSQIDSDVAKEAYKNIDEDRKSFPVVVQAEVEQVLSTQANILIFTNQQMRKATFSFKALGEKPRELPFESLLSNTDPVLKANPLSDLQNFEETIKYVASFINQNKFEKIALIFKSHGTKEFALTPRLSFWSFDQDKEELSRILQGEENLLARRGILRENFIKSLRGLRTQIERPVELVVLESCGAPIEKTEYEFGKQAIISFFTNSETEAAYSSIDYSVLVESIDPVGRLSNQLRESSDFMEYKALSTLDRLKRNYVYFIPLLLVFSLFCGLRIRKIRQQSKAKEGSS